jgi:hypothetical protein
MQITIEHISSDGYRRNKYLKHVTSVYLDWGHELNGQVVPALRLDSKEEHPYFLTQVYDVEKLYEETQNFLQQNYVKSSLLIPMDVFDPVLPEHNQSTSYNLKSYLRQLPFHKFARTESFAVFSIREIELLTKGNLQPIYNRNPGKLASLWRATLPIPESELISKQKFFHEILVIK